MIKDKTPLCMHEVRDLIEKSKETDRVKDIDLFIKKYSKLNSEKSEKLKKDLEKLDIIRLKQIDIIKIVDMAPENAIELNKIVIEAGLEADETNKILETIKNNK